LAIHFESQAKNNLKFVLPISMSSATPHLSAEAKASLPAARSAVIMDGNGRWAKQRGLPRIEGHPARARNPRASSSAPPANWGVKYLTLYAFFRRELETTQG